MAGTERPFEAYRGDAPYIFVSYAHADADLVYPDLSFLKDGGYNVFYDEGISPGSRWTSELADAIEHCSLFIAFLSPAAVNSENCANEIEFAISRRRPLLVVHARETEVPPGMELSLGGRQALLKQQLTEEVYHARLAEGVGKLIAGEDPFIARQPATATPAATRQRRLAVAMAMVLIVIAVVVFRMVGEDSAPAAAELRLAIAVRPFDTSSVDQESRFFAQGVADDLVMRLGQWRTLPVIARGTSFSTVLPADPMAAGRTLNARYLVEGSVRSTGETLTLSIDLIDAADGRQVWSREYESAFSEALKLQSEIADTIVAQINPALISAETQRAVRRDPATLDAWSAAMRGWWHLNTETEEGLQKARTWFSRAAELDPAWSWPHSAQALTAYRALINGWSTDPGASVGVLIKSANKAVQLDAQDAFAHHALGHAYAMQGQLDQSLDALARGVELSPNDPMANGCYAMQLAASADAEKALAVIEHAINISPDDPWMHRFALVRARAHFAAAAYPDSEQWALRSLQLKPNDGAFLHSVAAPAMGDGLERARQRTDDRRSTGSLPPLAGIEQSFTRSTDPDYVTRLLEGLRRAGFE